MAPPRSLLVRLRRWCSHRSSCLQHGTGHGFGSFLNVHEGPQSFSSDTVLVPGHVITNEPGYCKFLLVGPPGVRPVSDSPRLVDNAGKWGMRIESALAVRRIKVRFAGFVVSPWGASDHAALRRPRANSTATSGLGLSVSLLCLYRRRWSGRSCSPRRSASGSR